MSDLNEREEAEKKLAADFGSDEAKLAKLIGVLDAGSRRERQQAARVVSAISKGSPDQLMKHVDALIDALSCAEAQTRWEILDALTQLVACDAEKCERALVGAETALFDEDSGLLRLSAMRFLCKLGSTSEARSEKVWPLVDEAIQCYHGDLEFQDMLNAVLEYSEGALSPEVKDALAARMSFDAGNGKGALKKKAAQIVANVS